MHGISMAGWARMGMAQGGYKGGWGDPRNLLQVNQSDTHAIPPGSSLPGGSHPNSTAMGTGAQSGASPEVLGMPPTDLVGEMSG